MGDDAARDARVQEILQRARESAELSLGSELGLESGASVMVIYIERRGDQEKTHWSYNLRPLDAALALARMAALSMEKVRAAL